MPVALPAGTSEKSKTVIQPVPVSAVFNMGGVVGYNDTQSSSIKNCYNIGTVRRKTGFTGSGGVGGVGDVNHNPAGVVGNNRGSVADCYYLTGASTIGGIGNAGLDGADVAGQAWVLDKEAFAQKNSFSGWGFDYTWRMDEMLGRPILRSIPESAVTISGKTVTAVYGTAVTTGFICLFGFYRYRRAAKCVCLYHHKRQRHLRCDAQRRYPDGSGNCGGGRLSATDAGIRQNHRPEIPCRSR